MSQAASASQNSMHSPHFALKEKEQGIKDDSKLGAENVDDIKK